jgi:hypothetical protein
VTDGVEIRVSGRRLYAFSLTSAVPGTSAKFANAEKHVSNIGVQLLGKWNLTLDLVNGRA